MSSDYERIDSSTVIGTGTILTQDGLFTLGTIHVDMSRADFGYVAPTPDGRAEFVSDAYVYGSFGTGDDDLGTALLNAIENEETGSQAMAGGLCRRGRPVRQGASRLARRVRGERHAERMRRDDALKGGAGLDVRTGDATTTRCRAVPTRTRSSRRHHPGAARWMGTYHRLSSRERQDRLFPGRWC
jgi:hypothetical protein